MYSCLYEGKVQHRRYEPVAHDFRYSLFLVYLDLAELDDVFRGRWLWSTRRAAIARFRRSDHLGDPQVPLDEAVRNLVAEKTGEHPAGPIRLLTHLRYFGYLINPVSFYYCFDTTGETVHAIVAEVNNTPWNERYCYVLPNPTREPFFTPKAFHVSPFLGMDMHYRWRLTTPADVLSVHMANWQDGRRVFDATLSLQSRPITGGQLARVLARHPLMTLKVVAGIYWQALRLKLKGVPFFPHPKHAENTETVSR
jgi:uncharacterized protein